MDHTRLPQTSVLNGCVLIMGDDAAVASLGDAQSVDRSARCICEGIVKFLASRVERNSKCLRELLDGFTYSLLG